MPRITQQIMIMIFFCSGIPAAVGREGGGMVSVGAGWTQGAWNSSLSCSPLPVVGSEKHFGSQKGSGRPGLGWAPLLLLQPWVGRAELVALRAPS